RPQKYTAWLPLAASDCTSRGGCQLPGLVRRGGKALLGSASDTTSPAMSPAVAIAAAIRRSARFELPPCDTIASFLRIARPQPALAPRRGRRPRPDVMFERSEGTEARASAQEWHLAYSLDCTRRV